MIGIILKQVKFFFQACFCLLVLTCSGCSNLRDAGDYWVDESHVALGQESRVQFLVFHYTAENDENSLRILSGNNVSVHYLINHQPEQMSGRPVVLQLVPEAQRAWHAGASFWRGRNNLNDTSIGVEIVNAGYHKVGNKRSWEPYNERQIDLLIALSWDIIQRHHIDPANVVGHSDIAPQRKIDPGPLFPWDRLAQVGIGAWPDVGRVQYYQRLREAETSIDIAELQANLKKYGYKVPETGQLDDETRRVIKAFQMHFRQDKYSGHPDAETLAILDALLEKYRR
ncbi:N-acetylmuramoyl-L-alanine amidase [Pragia fontium]|nr:N-acetylmuramoyl-L-alanine amidase [Pragia fontium]